MKKNKAARCKVVYQLHLSIWASARRSVRATQDANMSSMLCVVGVLISVSTITAACLWCWYQWCYRRQLAVARTLPTCLPTLPLLGHIHFILFGVKNATENFLKLLSQPVSGTSCLWLGPVPLINVQKLEDVKKVLTSSKTLGRSAEYNLLKYTLGNGLLTCPVHIWKTTRRHINPVFHYRNLQHFIAAFNEASDQLVHNLSEHVDGGKVNVTPFVSILSLRNILSLLLGRDNHVDTDSSHFEESIELIESFAFAFGNRVRQVWLWSDFIFKFLYRDILDNIVKIWVNFVEPMVHQALKEKPNMVLDETTDWNAYYANYIHQKADDSAPITMPDVFNNLQQCDPQYGDEYMKQEIFTLLGVGTDTVNVTLSSCLLAMGSHPHIQEKVYNEIVGVVGVYSKYITMTDLSNMTYLDQVLKETMRIFSIVPIFARRCDEDLELSDCTIPANQTIVINTLALHMNPNVFPEPLKFDPDRFSADQVAQRERYSFLPFSGGPRDCIGKHYATVIMKMALAYVLREYEIYSEVDISNIKFKYGLTLVSTDGYNVELKRRKKTGLQI